MPMRRTFKTVGGWSAVIAICLGVSYGAELPKYRFERLAAETIRDLPGARVIGTMKSLDIPSPVSWFWPPTTTWNLALPDSRMADRFYTITLVYGEERPIVYLVDADCQTRRLLAYDLDEPESASPAVDLFGKPVVA